MKLIDKYAVLTEIKERMDYWKEMKDHCPKSDSQGIGTCDSRITELNDLFSSINSLEVKDVDLEKEIDRELETRWRGEYLFTSKFRESAKHFFELGLKAQKGE